MADAARIKALIEYAEGGDFSPPLDLTYNLDAYQPGEPEGFRRQKVSLSGGDPYAVTIPQTFSTVQFVLVRNLATGIDTDNLWITLAWSYRHVDNSDVTTENLQAIPPGGFVALSSSVDQAAGLVLTALGGNLTRTQADIVLIGRESA